MRRISQLHAATALLFLAWTAVAGPDQPWQETNDAAAATWGRIALILGVLGAVLLAAAKWGVRVLFAFVAVIILIGVLR